MVKFRHRCKAKKSIAISWGYSFDVMRIGYTICPIYGMSELLFLFKNVILFSRMASAAAQAGQSQYFRPCGLDFLCMGCHFLGLVCPEDLGAHLGFRKANQAVNRHDVCFQLSNVCFLFAAASFSVPTASSQVWRMPLPLCCMMLHSLIREFFDDET